jgi:hypothetical protein
MIGGGASVRRSGGVESTGQHSRHRLRQAIAVFAGKV